MVDPYTLAAVKYHGAPPGWKACAWNKMPDVAPSGFTLVRGAVPGVFKSGPRKGRDKWPPMYQQQTYFVSDEQRKAAIAEWESETLSACLVLTALVTTPAAPRLPGSFAGVALACGGEGSARIVSEVTG